MCCNCFAGAPVIKLFAQLLLAMPHTFACNSIPYLKEKELSAIGRLLQACFTNF
jgi:hypothetical protein